MVACLGFLHNPDNLLSSRKKPTLGYLFFVLPALIDAKKLPKRSELDRFSMKAQLFGDINGRFSFPNELGDPTFLFHIFK